MTKRQTPSLRAFLLASLLLTSSGVSAFPGAQAANSGTDVPAAAVAPSWVQWVHRPHSPWMAVSIALPKGDAPRESLLAIAALLNRPTGETDGTLGLVRSRGGQVFAWATAEGLVVDVEGAKHDAALLLRASLSLVEGIAVTRAQLEAALRPVRHTTQHRQLARSEAWRSFYGQAAPGAPISSPGRRELSPREVSAAARNLTFDRARLFVEGPSSPFGVDDKAAKAAVSDQLLQMKKRVYRGAQEDKRGNTKSEQPRQRLPLPAPAATMAQEQTQVLLAQPFPPSLSLLPHGKTLIAQHLAAAVFPAASTSDARVWIETANGVSLLFIEPPPEVTVDMVQERIRKWKTTKRLSRRQLDVAKAVADADRAHLYEVGDTAHQLARRSLMTHSNEKTRIGLELTPLQTRELLEELPLWIFPSRLRVFRQPPSPADAKAHSAKNENGAAQR